MPEVIDNEVWLLYPDGRLISMNRVAAPQIVAAGEAVEVPPERVRRDGERFVLVDDDAAAKAAAEDDDAAAAEDDDATEVKATEAATASAPKTAAQPRASGRAKA
jgi:hypothetical protein